MKKKLYKNEEEINRLCLLIYVYICMYVFVCKCISGNLNYQYHRKCCQEDFPIQVL